MNGIINFFKPKGMTSHGAVNFLRRKLNIRRIGHTGTLDPNVSGVLPLCIGKATRVSEYLLDSDKEYIGELTLGVETESQDMEGNIVNRSDLIVSEEEIRKVFANYIGEIYQIPPMYSALKVGGEELYKKARRGEIVERKERQVTIYSLKLLSLHENKIIFKVVCSKGTYIRTLGNDIAHSLGECGHLTMLTRTRVGKYKIEDAKSIEDIQENDVYSLEDALSYMSQIIVSGDLEKKVLNGVALKLVGEDLLLIKDINGKALALYRKESDGKHHCLRGLL